MPPKPIGVMTFQMSHDDFLSGAYWCEWHVLSGWMLGDQEALDITQHNNSQDREALGSNLSLLPYQESSWGTKPNLCLVINIESKKESVREKSFKTIRRI